MPRIVDSAIGVEVFVDMRTTQDEGRFTFVVRGGPWLGRDECSEIEDVLWRVTHAAGMAWPGIGLNVEVTAGSLDVLDDDDRVRAIVSMVAAGRRPSEKLFKTAVIRTPKEVGR